MRIIIANHIDPAIRDRHDLRAWTQRALWGARDGDLVVLRAPPDPHFLRYATALTGTDPNPTGPGRGATVSWSGYSSSCPLDRTKPSLDPSASGSTACSPGSPSSSSSITVARSVFVTKASDRPDELVSHVSRCPLSILARRASCTTSDDTGTGLSSLITQDSIMSTTISRTVL
ncbi:preATP grasp domain-containing protein [Streptomyces bobili]|uniref:preATP grasp domain-containing protein n=1 Tax=Streptomyces bobili TaxID=67280 RepID=UPI0037887B90